MKNQDNRKNRFGMVCRKLMTEQKKTLLYGVGGFLGINLIIGLWSGWMGMNCAGAGLAMYVLFTGFVIALVTSKMMFDMTNKEGRTALLMTPASAAEKFLPRLLTILPGTLILAIAGYIVLQYSNILATGLTYSYWPEFYNPFKTGPTDNNQVMSIFSMVSGFLFIESLFIFGAVAWPRRSFLKTLGIFIGLQILLSFGAIALSRTDIQVQILDPYVFGWIVISITAAMSCAIIYFAYLKFKKSSVIV